MPENCIALIDQLIDLRIEKGMTQRDLAVAAGVAQPMIARLERKTTIPQLNTLLKITEALGCTLTLTK
ncbi:MAG: helix-turn-helix transcriptional regulator [Clostridia bacterium]|nr:helix-turn-helix transcriptional regulator [Clostridia bacterium]